MTHGRAHKHWRAWLPKMMLALTITLGVSALVQLGAAAAVYLPFSHIDGAFQTASGLFRLQAGQLPGRDFFPYLGVGVLLGVYPPFLLYGGDFAASIAAAHLAVARSQALAFATVLYLCRGGRGFSVALAAGLLATAAALLWSQPPALLAERLFPGNSLRPLRSALPYLAVLVVHAALVRHDAASLFRLGLCAGLALIWSNDFALPTALGCGLAAFYITWQQRDAARWIRDLSLFVTGACLGLVPLLLATAGHLPALLAFNFIDVAGDQWWYYGPWNEEARIFGAQDLPRLLTLPTALGLLLLAGIAFQGLRRKHPALLALGWLGLILLLGGTLASVGGHLGGYFPPFHFWALLTTAGLLVHWLANRLPGPHLPDLALPICLLAGALLVAGAARLQLTTIESKAQDDEAHFRIPELGGYLHRSWESYIELARQADPDHSLFEEYWGIWSAMRRPAPLVPVDSVIHALGRLRDQGREMLEGRPDWIVTTLPHGWQTWSLSANYWLYQALLEHYEPVMTSPATVVWRHQPQQLEWQPVPCSISSTGDAVQVEAPARGYYELKLQHRPIPDGRRIALLRNNVPDAFHGWAAMQPGSTETLLPGFAPTAGEHEHRSLLLPGRQRERIELLGCTARRMSRQDPHMFASAAAVYPVTDMVWEHGFSRELPLLKVPDTLDNRRDLQPGARIEIAGETPRRILEVQARPPWLEVHFEGEPIKGSISEAAVPFLLKPDAAARPEPPISPGERRPF